MSGASVETRKKMHDPLHILIYAATPAQRSRIAELVRRSIKGALIACVASLSAAGGNAPPDLWIVDLETSASAARLLHVMETSPGDFGIAALIDDPDPQWVRAALQAGVNAILSREADAEELSLAVAAAEAGLVLLHPSSARQLTASSLLPAEPGFDEPEHLTPREREVLRLIGEGLGNKQIASRLAISEHTAKFHISSILGKLSVSSRAEAVSQGIKRGLIPI
jgi:DNA-binding NarL/FixJ family response regulator